MEAQLSKALLRQGLPPVKELSGMGQAGSLLPGCVLVLGMGSRTPCKAVPSRIGAAIPGTAHPCSAILNPKVGRDHQVSKSSGSLSQLDSVPMAAPTWSIPADRSPFIQAEMIDFFF